MTSPRSLALALAPGTLLAGIAGGIVFPIFPIVGVRVGIAAWLIGLILAANRAVRVVVAPFVGALADRIGGRRTLLIGLAIQVVVIALYLAGMLLHLEAAAFLVGRLVHGLGSACVFIAAQALALQAGHEGNRGTTAGSVRVAVVLGVPIGFVAGGLLSDAFGEIPTFAIAGGAVVVALIAASFTVPDLRATFAARPSAWAAVHAMRDKALLGVGSLNFALGFAAGGMVLTTLDFLVVDRHLHLFALGVQGTSGCLMAVMSLSDAAFTPLAGWIGDRTRSHAHVAAASLALSALGLVGLAFANGLATTTTAIAVVGLGSAGLGPSVLVLVGQVVEPARRGIGVGVVQLCGDAGGMCGPLVGTALLAGNMELPYLLTAGLVAAAVPIALWLARRLVAPSAQ